MEVTIMTNDQDEMFLKNAFLQQQKSAKKTLVWPKNELFRTRKMDKEVNLNQI